MVFMISNSVKVSYFNVHVFKVNRKNPYENYKFRHNSVMFLNVCKHTHSEDILQSTVSVKLTFSHLTKFVLYSDYRDNRQVKREIKASNTDACGENVSRR